MRTNGDLVLSGEDSIRLFRNFFTPTAEYINRVRSNIPDSNVTITITESGFDVDIPDLDLSFLEGDE